MEGGKAKECVAGIDDDGELSRLRMRLKIAGERRAEVKARAKELESTLRDILIEEQRLKDAIEATGALNPHVNKTIVDNVSVGNEAPLASPQKPQYLSEDDYRRNDRVALASYPRSGNSLLRSLLEKLYGVTTGSDADPKRTLNQQLVDMGMVGEGVVDERVWIVKTHFPERMGKVKFNAKRAIVLVRNPFDCIVSYFNMVITQSHTHSLVEEEYQKYGDIWDAFVYEETQVWKAFYEQWALVQAPTLFVRYEDIVLQREKSLTMIAEFLSGMPLPGELVEKIKELSSLDSEHAGVYGPRVAVDVADNGVADDSNSDLDGISGYAPLKPGSAFLRSLHRFTDAQKKHVLSSTRDVMHQMGYWDYIPNNPFAVREPQLGRSTCLIRHFRTKQKELYMKLNSCVPLRPQTEDDPWRRGFGRRWKRELSLLPAPRLRQRGAPTLAAPSASSGHLTADAFNQFCSAWIRLGTPPQRMDAADESVCAHFSDWSWHPIQQLTVFYAEGFLQKTIARDGIEMSFHIVYHPTYRVPALFFEALRVDGTPCNLDDVLERMHPRARELQESSTDLNTFITRDYHPYMHSFYYLVHPCQTALIMEELSFAAECSYLLTWWSTISPLFSLGLDPEVHARASERLLSFKEA